MKLCSDKIRRAKAHLELNLAHAVKGNRKCIHQYMSDKRRPRENLLPLVDGGKHSERRQEKGRGTKCLLYISL